MYVSPNSYRLIRWVFSALPGTINRPSVINTSLTSRLVMSHIVLPDALSSWPWPRQVNQHYCEVKAELEAWIHSTEILDANAQKAFDKCDFGPFICNTTYYHVSLT